MPDFEDGFNIVLWSSLDDLLDKIDYYAAHENDRLQIAARGLKTVRLAHTNVHRAERFGEILKSWT